MKTTTQNKSLARSSTKAQIQMGETIAVLFVFFILIIMGMVFYTQYMKNDLQEKKEKSQSDKSVEIAQRLMFLPELECGNTCVSERSNCIDILKLEQAGNLMAENEKYYYDLFEFSEINVTQIYPDTTSWGLYSRSHETFKSSFETNIPVALCDPVTRRYSFGILTVKTQLR